MKRTTFKIFLSKEKQSVNVFLTKEGEEFLKSLNKEVTPHATQESITRS